MSAVRRASTQLLTQRSVHVRIVPRPANVGESREVLRVLQRFGELTMYKSLRVCSPCIRLVSGQQPVSNTKPAI